MLFVGGPKTLLRSRFATKAWWWLDFIYAGINLNSWNLEWINRQQVHSKSTIIDIQISATDEPWTRYVEICRVHFWKQKWVSYPYNHIFFQFDSPTIDDSFFFFTAIHRKHWQHQHHPDSVNKFVGEHLDSIQSISWWRSKTGSPVIWYYIYMYILHIYKYNVYIYIVGSSLDSMMSGMLIKLQMEGQLQFTKLNAKKIWSFSGDVFSSLFTT